MQGLRGGTPWGSSTPVGQGLSAIMGLQQAAEQYGGPVSAQSTSMPNTTVGYNPSTGWSSITNQYGVTTYTNGNTQAAGPGSRGLFSGIFGGRSSNNGSSSNASGNSNSGSSGRGGGSNNGYENETP